MQQSLREITAPKCPIRSSNQWVMNELPNTGDLTYVSNVRHIQLLKQAKQALEDAMEGLELGLPLDIVQIDWRLWL